MEILHPPLCLRFESDIKVGNNSSGSNSFWGVAGGIGKHEIYVATFFFTALKRSLGQGNIFKSVRQEFCSRGCVPGPGGGVWSWGVPGPGTATPPGWLLLRAVHILLECILVMTYSYRVRWHAPGPGLVPLFKSRLLSV